MCIILCIGDFSVDELDFSEELIMNTSQSQAIETDPPPIVEFGNIDATNPFEEDNGIYVNIHNL
jgi:hypothetical protein